MQGLIRISNYMALSPKAVISLQALMKDIFFFVYVLQNVFAQQPVCGEI
jgi:hypothetical protein